MVERQRIDQPGRDDVAGMKSVNMEVGRRPTQGEKFSRLFGVENPSPRAVRQVGKLRLVQAPSYRDHVKE